MAFNGVFGPGGFSWPAVGFGGDIWFPHTVKNSIGRLNISTGAVTDVAIPTTGAGPAGLIEGPDQAMWFTENLSGKIGRIATDGTLTEMSLPSGTNAQPTQIVIGPDNALWFVESGSGKIARIASTATPANPQVTEFPMAYPGCVNISLTSGPLNSLRYIGCTSANLTIDQVSMSGV